jgi:PAS domain S-box-containing protein
LSKPKSGAPPTPQRDAHPTLGFLSTIIGGIVRPVWLGMIDEARELGANTIFFPGACLLDPDGARAQRNIVYQLVDGDIVDGLVTWPSQIGNYITEEQLSAFHERYRPLPVITIIKKLEGFPAVLIDNREGMRDAVSHLIETHGYSRLAFIRGPERHEYAEQRHRTYIETLRAHGIPVDEKLITPPSPWGLESGREAMRLLVDARGLVPGSDFQAVVSASEEMLMGALEVLRDRGVRVPQDVAVVGFDDTILSQANVPPLTTVASPFYETGRRAAKTLRELIIGKTVAQKTSMQARLVIRQSCGCIDPAVQMAAAVPVKARSGESRPALSSRQARITAAMSQAVGEPSRHSAEGWAKRLYEGFLGDVQGKSSGLFLRRLAETLRQAVAAAGAISEWNAAVSALRMHALPSLTGRQSILAENLWHQARVMIGEMTQLSKSQFLLNAVRQSDLIREIEIALVTTFDIAALMDALAVNLPKLGVPGCYLSVYEAPKPYRYPQPAPEWSRLVLAYGEEGRAEIEPGGRRFKSSLLVPEGMLPKDRPFSIVVEALVFQERQLGFVLFEAGPRDSDVYEALSVLIASALGGALLVQRVRERSAELARQKYILDTFMETVPDTIYFKDLESRITRANSAHAERLGLASPVEEIGKTDFDFFPEEMARAKFEREQEIIRTGQPVTILEESTGSWEWELTTKMPLRDEDGRIIGTFGISRDITDLKRSQAALESAYAEVGKQVEERTAELRREIAERTRAEDEIRRLNAELEQRVAQRTSQLEASNKELETFSYSISHDLRAPLRAIAGYSQILNNEHSSSLSSESVRLLDLIALNAQQMGRLIDDLLNFTRLHRRPLVIIPVTTVEVVRQALDSLKTERQGRRVEISIGELPVCLGDLELLRQVWINLLSNALKFTRTRETAVVEIGCNVQEDGTQAFYVKDNGVGFDMRYAGKLFGVFQRLHRPEEYEGTGVGLAIVQRIVIRHGGRVWTESRLDQGATFSFTLPNRP